MAPGRAGDSEWESDTCTYEQIEATFAAVRALAFAKLERPGTPPILTYHVGKSGYREINQVDEDQYNILVMAEYGDVVPVTFDTSDLDGMTVTEARVEVQRAFAGDAFEFRLMDGAVQLGDDKTGDSPDAGDWWVFELADPDSRINKTGETEFTLEFAISEHETADETGWTGMDTWRRGVGFVAARLLVKTVPDES